MGVGREWLGNKSLDEVLGKIFLTIKDLFTVHSVPFGLDVS